MQHNSRRFDLDHSMRNATFDAITIGDFLSTKFSAAGGLTIAADDTMTLDVIAI